MANRQRARAPLRGQARRHSRAPRRRWLEPRSATGRAIIGPRSTRAPTQRKRAPWATPCELRSEHELPPEWQAGGERERRRADERGDAAKRRGGACSSRDQQRAEREPGRGAHEHRRNQNVRHGRRRVHCAASKSCHGHCEPAASESAAARTSARRSRAPRRRWLETRSAASRARVVTWTARAPTQGDTGAMCDVTCNTLRARAAAGIASRQRA